MGRTEVFFKLQGNDGSGRSHAERSSDNGITSGKYGERIDRPIRGNLSLEAKIEQYSDEEIEKELQNIWAKPKFWTLPASVAQATKICKALIQMEKHASQMEKHASCSQSSNSSMVEARKSIDELLQRIKNNRVDTSAIQCNSDAFFQDWNVGKNWVYFTFKQLELAEKQITAVNYLISQGPVFENENKAIKSPYSRVAELAMANKISRDHKKQILAISYLMDMGSSGLIDSDLIYIEAVLSRIYKEINEFQW